MTRPRIRLSTCPIPRRFGALTAAVTIGLVAATIAAIPAQAAAPRTTRTAGATVVVAPNGCAGARGTLADPVAGLQAAAARLTHGGTIYLRGGTYHQRLRLSGARNLTVAPYPGEHVTLDGTGLRPPDGPSALIEITRSSHVTVRGLDLTGYRTTRPGAVPIGIYVHGWADHLSIIGNHIHRLGNDNPTLGSFDINAHGIAVYGDDPARAITALALRGNTLDHLVLGASETVVVNGNVTGWSITGNDIHDSNNIGIDAIGYEDTLTGQWRYTDRNRARNGLIEGNRVDAIKSAGNPAYYDDGSYCDCADGIYVDGGTHIVIRANHVTNSDIGIEVAAENARGAADHVAVLGNRVSGSGYVGITTGGYCNGAEDCGGVKTGRSFDNLFAGNVLRGNNRFDDGSPELLVQYYAPNNRFVGNDITATNRAHAVYGTVPGADRDGHSGGNTSDDNVFRTTSATGQASFGWLGHTYPSFSSYHKHTGQDRHSRLRRA